VISTKMVRNEFENIDTSFLPSDEIHQKLNNILSNFILNRTK